MAKNGLMSGLKEFGTNFLLTAGTQIAENIKEQSKQDKADILTQTKLLRSTIAKNKAADAKIQKNITNQANTLLAMAPSLPQNILRQALVSDDSYKQFKKTIEDDIASGKSGYFLSDWAKQNNIEPNSIYKVSDKKRRPTSTIVSELRTPTAAPARAKPVSSESESIFKTLLGAGMGPDRILDEAEKRIGRSGRGSIGQSDLRYAYGTPTRGISRPDNPAIMKRVNKIKIQDTKAFSVFKNDYLKEAQKLGLMGENFKDAEVTPEALQLASTKTGFESKLQVVLNTLPTGDPNFIKDRIKTVFKDSPEMQNFLMSRALKDYADARTTFKEELSQLSENIVSGGRSTDMLNPPR